MCNSRVMKSYFVYFFLFFPCYSQELRDIWTIEDKTSENVKDFGYNKDALLNFTKLTAKYGYLSEEHQVVTADGYILTFFRIPRGVKCNEGVKPTPVLMMHGIIDSSDTFIIAGPDVSLAYILADACHDVWCGNVRGNKYSRDHVALDPDKDEQFWDYSYHEHGIYDLLATIDYVLENTGADGVNYIGHSQGCIAFLVLTTIHPEYNNKINIAILLAPVAWVNHVSSPLLQVVAQNYQALVTPLKLIGVHEILSQNEKAFKFLEFLCQFLPETICGSGITAVFGEIPENISPETISAVIGHVPAGTSLKNVEHFAQGVQEDVFRQFNYGPDQNLAVYYQENPPEYDLTKIELPVFLIRGKSDKISRQEDIHKLLSRLPNVEDYYTIPDNDWAHLHFIMGDRIPIVLAPKVLEYLDQYSSSSK